jgi:hypothetical protein
VNIPEGFREAEVLADFANLKPTDSRAAEHFARNYPDFAPAEWWTYPCRTEGTPVVRVEDFQRPDGELNLKALKAWQANPEATPQWRATLHNLRVSWRHNRFDFKFASNLSELLQMVFVLDRPGMLWGAAKILVPGKGVLDLPIKTCGFHKGVLYLSQHPKQAKMCKRCGRFFVHQHGKQQFCQHTVNGESCRVLGDRARHLADYHEKDRNSKRQKKSRDVKRRRTASAK